MSMRSIRRIMTLNLLTGLFALSSCGSEVDTEMSHVLENEGEDYAVLITQGPYLSAQEVRSHVKNAGFPSSLHDTLVRIARCESSFGTRSYAWAGGNRHTGLFQISDLHRQSCGYGSLSREQWHAKMTAPALNAKCAYVVYRNAGNSLRPWDCFTGRR